MLRAMAQPIILTQIKRNIRGKIIAQVGRSPVRDGAANYFDANLSTNLQQKSLKSAIFAIKSHKH